MKKASFKIVGKAMVEPRLNEFLLINDEKEIVFRGIFGSGNRFILSFLEDEKVEVSIRVKGIS